MMILTQIKLYKSLRFTEGRYWRKPHVKYGQYKTLYKSED